MPGIPNPVDHAVQQMTDLVRGLALALVEDPGHLRVESDVQGTEAALRLFVTEDDLGKLIGKQGRTARSLRTVLSATGNKLHLRCTLDIQSEQ